MKTLNFPLRQNKPYRLQRRILSLSIIFMTIVFVTLTIGVPIFNHLTLHDWVDEEINRVAFSLQSLLLEEVSTEEKVRSRDILEGVAAENPAFWYYAEGGNRVIHSAGNKLPLYRDRVTASTTMVDYDGNLQCMNEGVYFQFQGQRPGMTTVWRIDCDDRHLYVEFGGVVEAPLLFWDKVLYEYSQSNRTKRSFLPFVILTVFLTGFIIVAFRSLMFRVTEVAANARRIGSDGEYRQLPTERLPAEILPLVEAFNDAMIRLRKAKDRQDFFLAAAAHEIRTPLTILRTRIAGFPKSTLKEEVAADLDRVASLVSQLLALSRLSSSEIVAEDVDFVDAIKRICINRTPLAIEQGRDLSFTLKGAPVSVLGDRRHIQSAVANLIDNAIMHTPPGTTVQITIGGASVSVCDEGPGVDEGTKAQIFEPFFKHPPNKKGQGLGLALVKEIMQLHGGRVTVDSAPGGGACFKLTFREKSTQ
ncbi:HAMP domain-containing histidine kinase [Pacificimonas sp. WHA3]|uniref:histidine kinase n=1 Tax=Pacificimonas pallii TaxID=2827236 RepID=A0ABS6SEZ1_9SPHN|nr:HAMP domain-containing sensor histidine kinase [Pacificimonas pallii]MBV7256977.1 HAMP domain-containing histidine kinase [Pacificimonas pallii]